MNLTELEKLADAASNDVHIYTEPRDSNYWHENRAFINAATPQAIKQLIALCRLQNSAIEAALSDDQPYIVECKEAIAAYEQMNGGE